MSVKIWDVSTGLVLRNLTGHTDDALSVSWSPDGSRIVSGSKDISIKIWPASMNVPMLPHWPSYLDVNISATVSYMQQKIQRGTVHERW